MATYASTANIQSAIGGDPALAWVSSLLNKQTDTNAVTSALDWGTSLIDTYVTGTPGTTGTQGAMWASTPTRAVQCCIDLAIYTLYQRIRREVPESWQQIKDAWVAELTKVNAGTISWVTTENPSSVNTGRVYYFGSGSTARDDNPRRTRRDQLDAI